MKGDESAKDAVFALTDGEREETFFAADSKSDAVFDEALTAKELRVSDDGADVNDEEMASYALCMGSGMLFSRDE